MPSVALRLRSAPLTFSLLCLLFLALPTTGCGHGHGHYHGHVVLRGELEVFNLASSRADMEGVETEAVGGGYDDFHSVRAGPGTGVLLDLVATRYDVHIYWDTGSRETHFDVPVHHASVTTLDVRF